jgi:hypothetical protein
VAQELAQAQALALARAAPEDLASRWSPAMEKLARHAMKKATRLAWQYEAIADAARRLNDRLSIISGLLGALVGTGSLVGAATPVSANPAIGIGSASWPTAISVIIGYAISVIAVLVTNWRLSETQSKGVTAKVGLLNTAREIRWQLAQPVADRADAYEFVYAREAEIAHILAAAPPREDWVRENYRRGVAGGTAADEDVLDETPPATPPAIPQPQVQAQTQAQLQTQTQPHTAIELPRFAESNTPLRPAVDLLQQAASLFPQMMRTVEQLGVPHAADHDMAATRPPDAGERLVGTPNLLQKDPLRALAMLKGAFDAARVNDT